MAATLEKIYEVALHQYHMNVVARRVGHCPREEGVL